MKYVTVSARGLKQLQGIYCMVFLLVFVLFSVYCLLYLHGQRVARKIMHLGRFPPLSRALKIIINVLNSKYYSVSTGGVLPYIIHLYDIAPAPPPLATHPFKVTPDVKNNLV